MAKTSPPLRNVSGNYLISCNRSLQDMALNRVRSDKIEEEPVFPLKINDGYVNEASGLKWRSDTRELKPRLLGTPLPGPEIKPFVAVKAAGVCRRRGIRGRGGGEFQRRSVALLGRLTQLALGDAIVAATRPTRLKMTGRSR
jgi:hypothetical protein